MREPSKGSPLRLRNAQNPLYSESLAPRHVLSRSQQLLRPIARWHAPALVVKLRSGHTSALPRYQTPGSGRQNLRQTSLPTRLRATRRFPFGINASPYRISACVIAVMNNWDGGWPANQARTVSAGAGFTTSETTFVSRTIICRSSAADGSVRAALPAIPLL